MWSTFCTFYAVQSDLNCKFWDWFIDCPRNLNAFPSSLHSFDLWELKTVRKQAFQSMSKECRSGSADGDGNSAVAMKNSIKCAHYNLSVPQSCTVIAAALSLGVSFHWQGLVTRWKLAWLYRVIHSSWIFWTPPLILRRMIQSRCPFNGRTRTLKWYICF